MVVSVSGRKLTASDCNVPKSYNWKLKNRVRTLSFVNFSGRQYDQMVDLPGGECLSLVEAIHQQVVSPSATFYLAENDYCPRECKDWAKGEVYRQIPETLNRIGIDPSRYRLYHGNIFQLPFTPNDRIGILNCDLMTQPGPESLEFIERVPYQDDAGVIATFQNPATRWPSAFMQQVRGLLEEIYGLHSLLDSVYLQKQFGLTLDEHGHISQETMRESKANLKFLDWGAVVFACIMYAMRHHEFEIDKVITYSCHENCLTFRMTSIVLSNVRRHPLAPGPHLAPPPPGRIMLRQTLRDMKQYFKSDRHRWSAVG
jgi:hypothetical protein